MIKSSGISNQMAYEMNLLTAASGVGKPGKELFWLQLGGKSGQSTHGFIAVRRSDNGCVRAGGGAKGDW